MSNALIINDFNFSSFVEYAKKAQTVKGADGALRNDSNSSDFSFTQTNNLQEAYDMANNGWEAGIQQLEKELELIVNGEMETFNSVAGGYVDVGAFLSGNPECMVQHIDRVERDKPQLTIYTQLTYNGGKKATDAMEYAKKILGIIVKAEQTHQVRLVGVFATLSRDAKVNHLEFIELKGYEQNFVLNSLAFAFHPSFFRRIWFKYIESKEYRGYGYGSSLGSSETLAQIKKHNETSFGGGKNWFLPCFNEVVLKWEESDITIF